MQEDIELSGRGEVENRIVSSWCLLVLLNSLIRVQNIVFGCNLSADRMNSFHFRDKPFIITIQVYVPTTNAKEAEHLQDLLELTPKKRKKFLLSQGTGMQKWEVERYLK